MVFHEEVRVSVLRRIKHRCTTRGFLWDRVFIPSVTWGELFFLCRDYASVVSTVVVLLIRYAGEVDAICECQPTRPQHNQCHHLRHLTIRQDGSFVPGKQLQVPRAKHVASPPI